MAEPFQPHDKLLRGLLDQPGTAPTFMQERLPGKVYRLLDGSPPVPIEGTFVDEALQGSQSDRLFRLRLRDGRDAFLYVLIDHKSTPDPGILLQLMGYTPRIWRQHAGDKASALRALPPIFPIVIYHGAREWSESLSLRNTIAAPMELMGYQPDFQYTLIDLGPIPDLELSEYPPLRAGLTALKYAKRDWNRGEVLAQIFRDAGDHRTLFRMLITYMVAAYTGITEDKLRQAIQTAKPEWEEEMGTLAQEWMAQGEARGRAEGEARGEAKGKAKTLLRLLDRRFGTLSSDMEARIQGADNSQLDDWLDRILDARELSDVFGTEKQKHH